MMLQRNLLYTGTTRARKLVVLAGSRRALAAAIRTKGAGRRHTALAHRLHPHPAHPLNRHNTEAPRYCKHPAAGVPPPMPRLWVHLVGNLRAMTRPIVNIHVRRCA
jgi:hypothetical protein